MTVHDNNHGCLDPTKWFAQLLALTCTIVFIPRGQQGLARLSFPRCAFNCGHLFNYLLHRYSSRTRENKYLKILPLFCHFQGVLRLKTSAMAADYRPIDSECDCLVCKNYSRAHLHAKITKVRKYFWERIRR